jgi:hypothetical protein
MAAYPVGEAGWRLSTPVSEKRASTSPAPEATEPYGWRSSDFFKSARAALGTEFYRARNLDLT